MPHAVDDVDPVAVREGADQSRRGRRPADHEHPAARDIDIMLVEVVQQVVPDRRNPSPAGDPLGLDHGREGLRLEEPVRHDEGGARTIAE